MRYLLAALVLSLAACSAPAPAADPPAVPSWMAAEIDDQPWSATPVPRDVRRAGDLLSFAGVAADGTRIAVSVRTRPGVLIYQADDGLAVRVTRPAPASQRDLGWAMPRMYGVGALTFATLTATRATGTFRVVVEPDDDSAARGATAQVVGQGQFALTF